MKKISSLLGSLCIFLYAGFGGGEVQASPDHTTESLKWIVDQSEARVSVIQIFENGEQRLLFRNSAGVAKNSEWRVRPGKYEITLLAQRYRFTGWGTPLPRAGCGIQITPIDNKPAIVKHPDKVILFHTEPSRYEHPSHEACVRKNGEYVRSLTDVRENDLFKGKGHRSHGCIRLAGEDARYLFTQAIRHMDKIRVIVKK